MFIVSLPVLVIVMTPLSVLQYDKPDEAKVPESLEVLSSNLDVIVNLAERHYYNCNFRECYKLTNK